jgi:copper resistance protein C
VSSADLNEDFAATIPRLYYLLAPPQRVVDKTIERRRRDISSASSYILVSEKEARPSLQAETTDPEQRSFTMDMISSRKFHGCLAHGLFAAALLAASPSLLAHTSPVTMTPAADGTVSAPDSVTINFTGALEPKFSMITVTDASGHVVNKEASVVGADTKTMKVALPPLKPGVYTVHWVGVSTDTHRSQGDYKFTVK